MLTRDIILTMLTQIKTTEVILDSQISVDQFIIERARKRVEQSSNVKLAMESMRILLEEELADQSPKTVSPS